MEGDVPDRPATHSHRAIGDGVWYLVAGVSYVALGISHKWLLNWFIGPVWLVATVVLGPLFADLVARRWGRVRSGR